MKWIASFLGGAILGISSVALHNAFLPFGLVISLLGTWVGVSLIGKACGDRKFKVSAALGWIAIVLRASLPGVGGELLVEGNFAGNTLITVGIILVVAAVFVPI
ncbi:MAG: hypothetical protein WDO06_07310 [Actinomycetota bacterium]